MTEKGNKTVYSDPAASCPKSVSELVKKLAWLQDHPTAKTAIL